MLSGLQGQALRVEADDVPSKGGVRAVVPEPCYDRSPTATHAAVHSSDCACTKPKLTRE